MDRRRLIHFLFASLIVAQLCSLTWAQSPADPALTAVRGKLQSITNDTLGIQTVNGLVQVKIRQPLITYARVPSDLRHITSSSYVGVTSEKQATGTEVAKQINIFPPELRGLGAGSFMLPAAPGTPSQNRMTNGSVARPVNNPGSRMTNGTVQKSGNAMVVRYKDGAQTISVPQNVEVNEIVPKKITLAVGDTVNAASEKQADGTLTTNKVYLIAGNSGSK